MGIEKFDLLVVGGGAAGMAAALTAKAHDPKAEVAILEKKEALGKKLRATGNGRCNLSNTAIPGVEETIAFFKDQGIPVRADETGRLYPFSESAAAVVETLALRIHQAGILVYTEAAVEALTPKDGGFLIKTTAKTFRANKIILATGGKAGPAYGCTGDGYTLAKALGHQITKTLPVLTGVMCEALPAGLKGVRVKGQLTLYFEQTPVFSEIGEVQFTDYGISGICVFNLSRHLVYRDARKLTPYTITLDIHPGESFEDFFFDQRKINGQTRCFDFLRGVLKEDLAHWVAEQWGVSEKSLLMECTPSDFVRLEETLHGLKIQPTGVMGFKMAQCTTGGIEPLEVHTATFESRLVPGLYFAGELLDYDGPCGGYNLDHAFRTGRQAAMAALSTMEDMK